MYLRQLEERFMENPRLNKHDSMQSINTRVSGESEGNNETNWDLYQRLGHDEYFERNERLDGLTKEQVEVKSKNFNKETLQRLFDREGSKTDNL